MARTLRAVPPRQGDQRGAATPFTAKASPRNRGGGGGPHLPEGDLPRSGSMDRPRIRATQYSFDTKSRAILASAEFVSHVFAAEISGDRNRFDPGGPGMNDLLTSFERPSALRNAAGRADSSSWLLGLDLGRYLVRKLLGEGGMGVVVQALDRRRDEIVAL